MRPFLRGLFSVAIFLVCERPNAQQPELILPIGHTMPISGICFSPDGELVITNSEEERNLKIWETRTGQLIRTIDAHADKITSASFSPDGNYLLTTGHDRTAKVWNMKTGQLHCSINYQFSNWIEHGFFSNDNRTVLLASDDAMELHDIFTKKLVRFLVDTVSFSEDPAFGRSRHRFYDCDMTPDGKYSLTVNSDSSIKIWSNETGKIIRRTGNSNSSYYRGSFNHSGDKYLATTRYEVSVWETASGKLLFSKKSSAGGLVFAAFTPDGKSVLTSSIDTLTRDGQLELWDLRTGARIKEFALPEKKAIVAAVFSGNSKFLLTMGLDGGIRLWESPSGKYLREVTKPAEQVTAMMSEIKIDDLLTYMVGAFSKDGKYVGACSLNNIATLQQTASGIQDAKLNGISSMITQPRYSADGKLMATTGMSVTLKTGDKPKGIGTVWDLRSGNMLYELKGHRAEISDIKFSADNLYIATASADSTARVWDTQTGRMLHTIGGHEQGVYKCYFADSSRYLVTQTFAGIGRIWDLETSSLIGTIEHEKHSGKDFGIYFISPSSSGKYLKTAFYEDYTTRITETATGKTLYSFKPTADSAQYIGIDPSEKYIYYGQGSSLKITEISSGKTSAIAELKKNTGLQPAVADMAPWMAFEKNGARIAIAGKDSTIRIMEFPSGRLLGKIGPFPGNVYEFEFSEDGKNLVLYFISRGVQIWDLATGTLAKELKIADDDMFGFSIVRNGRLYVVTRSYESLLKIWDAFSGTVVTTALDKFNHSLTYVMHPSQPEFVIDNKFSVDMYRIGSASPSLKIISAADAGYLVTDSAGRFDGSNDARKMLYFTCGTEIIGLDQVKDQLWVPGLAGRVYSGEQINSSGLRDINICGLTPQVKETANDETGLRYQVTPRRGGLGETVLYVNGIEAKRYSRSQLKKSGDHYVLEIKKTELTPFLASGQNNRISLKAYTASNDISSRSVIADEESGDGATARPNLYAIMIGVSDYKGEELDLKYAAKDATDISGVLAVSARKLLNTDGKEHVFIYNLTTEKNRSALPDKNSIRNAFAEISKKALANDILLIFFAGHGMMAGEKKQFYFLTADASRLAAAEATEEVGISTAEISEWMKPQNIRAQKRILIFDACNSGQAIRDFVKMGGDDQGFLAARDDESTQQARAIEKLNEKAGLFILSASASNQKAYEMSRFSQGVLTYSLLKAIKLQPDILDNGKFLNVSRWFGAAEKEVTEVSAANGVRQQPQVISNTNFTLGIVDADVTASVNLPQEKPMFTASNFQNNDPDIADDDLELSRLVNIQMSEAASRAGDSPIMYTAAIQSSSAYTLTGRYDVKPGSITVSVNVKLGKIIKHRFQESGDPNKLGELVSRIVNSAAALVK